MPSIFATQRIDGSIFPNLLGGVQTTIFGQPAKRAGIACIIRELNNGAVPPGIYKPTVSIGLNSDHNLIPFVVSLGFIESPGICF